MPTVGGDLDRVLVARDPLDVQVHRDGDPARARLGLTACACLMIFRAAARPAAASGAPDAGEESPQATRLAAPSIATAIIALAPIFADRVCASRT